MIRWLPLFGLALLLALVVGRVAHHGNVTYLGKGDMILQTTSVTCGPAALAYVLEGHGLSVDESTLAKKAGTAGTGTSMLGLVRAAESFGFTGEGLQMTYDGLRHVSLPVIAVFKDHFVVVTEVTPTSVTVGDPLAGFFRYGRGAFVRSWQGQVMIVRR